MNEECYISLQSAGRGVTFTKLLTMVATEAEQSKFSVDRHAQVNEQMVVGSAEENETEKCIDSSANRAAGNIEEGFLDTNLEFSTETLTQPGAAFDRREGNFGSKLPDESIGTSCFVDSSVNFGGSNCSDGISKASFSRTISNYQLEEDCGATDVTSQVREFNGGLIEESMRKYCEDKKSVMFEPEVGMQFSSTEEAFQFYNMYSWVLGFSIRLGDNYTTKTKKGQCKNTFASDRYRRIQGNGDETKNSTTRCGCKAMMRVATNDSCKWYVKKFIAEHNHDMVESCGERKVPESPF